MIVFIVTKEKALIREEFRRRGRWVDRWDGKTNEKVVWSRRDTPCCEKVFASRRCVWTEAGQRNVGMKFWNERTMKKRG